MEKKEIKLGEICDLQNGCAFSSKDYVEESDVLNCRMSNIRPNGTFDDEYAKKYLPNEYAEKYKDWLLKDGDVIIAMTDMADNPKILGVPTTVNTNGKTFLMNQRVGKLIFTDKEVNKDFVKYNLLASKHKAYYKRLAGGGLQLNISKKDILNLPIAMYSKEDQNIITEELDTISDLIAIRKQQLSDLENLLQGKIDEYFN